MKVVSRVDYAEAMTRLMRNDDFQMLRSRWVQIRHAIVEAGKKKREPEQWSVLEGFDKAVMEPENAVVLEETARKPRRQPKVPTEDLET